MGKQDEVTGYDEVGGADEGKEVSHRAALTLLSSLSPQRTSWMIRAPMDSQSQIRVS